jgi:hypothetical protein
MKHVNYNEDALGAAMARERSDELAAAMARNQLAINLLALHLEHVRSEVSRATKAEEMGASKTVLDAEEAQREERENAHNEAQRAAMEEAVIYKEALEQGMPESEARALQDAAADARLRQTDDG